MKKLFSFILFALIVGGAFHLIRVHDQKIVLSQEQISLMDATHYASEKDSRITASKEESAIRDVANLEKAMFKLINRDRSSNNVDLLQFSSRLCNVARIHSRDMARSDKVFHDLPGCQNLSERLQGAGLKVLKQGENVASALSVEDAQESLMKSPGHRQIMLDPDFSSVGIGIVIQGNHLYITQNFVSFIPEVSPSQGKRMLLGRINQLRSSRLRENPTLSSIAQEHSEKMAASGRVLDTDILEDKLVSRGIKFQKVIFLIIGAPTIEQIEEETKKNQDIRSGSMNEIGIGLRQSNDGNLWVTIILKK